MKYMGNRSSSNTVHAKCVTEAPCDFGAPRELQAEFTRNRVTYLQLDYNPVTEVYVYKRVFAAGGVVYEVFRRKIHTQFNRVSYPGNSAFGFWALTFPTYEQTKHYLENGISAKTKLSAK